MCSNLPLKAKIFFTSVFLCAGGLSTLISLISISYPIQQCGFNITIVVWGVPLIYGLYSLWPRRHITVSLDNRLKVDVMVGNIWDIKEGIVVIPVNNFLDIQNDDIVVGTKTLHGQFIDVYKKRYPGKDLRVEIQNSLKKEGLECSGTYPNRKYVVGHGFEQAYPLGEIIRLKEGNLQYYLVVLTEFDENNHPINQAEKYPMILLKMLKKIDQWNSGVPVYLPLMGSGQTGISLTKQKMLEVMLSCFNMTEHYVAKGGTTIIVYKQDLKEISLSNIKYLYSK